MKKMMKNSLFHRCLLQIEIDPHCSAQDNIHSEYLRIQHAQPSSMEHPWSCFLLFVEWREAGKSG